MNIESVHSVVLGCACVRAYVIVLCVFVRICVFMNEQLNVLFNCHNTIIA